MSTTPQELTAAEKLKLARAANLEKARKALADKKAAEAESKKTLQAPKPVEVPQPIPEDPPMMEQEDEEQTVEPYSNYTFENKRQPVHSLWPSRPRSNNVDIDLILERYRKRKLEKGEDEIPKQLEEPPNKKMKIDESTPAPPPPQTPQATSVVDGSPVQASSDFLSTFGSVGIRVLGAVALYFISSAARTYRPNMRLPAQTSQKDVAKFGDQEPIYTFYPKPNNPYYG